MQKSVVQRLLTLLSVGVAALTLFSGCHFFEPGISDNQEPTLENANDEGAPTPGKFTGK